MEAAHRTDRTCGAYSWRLGLWPARLPGETDRQAARERIEAAVRACEVAKARAEVRAGTMNRETGWLEGEPQRR